jgi:hypothetical protein
MTLTNVATLTAALWCACAPAIAAPAATAQDAAPTTSVEQFTPLTSKGRLAPGFLVVASARESTKAERRPGDPGCIQYPNASLTITCAVPGKRYDACWFAAGQAHSRDVFFCALDPWTRRVVRISLRRFSSPVYVTANPRPRPMAVELTDGRRCALPAVVDTTAPQDRFLQGYDCGGGLRLDNPSGTPGTPWTANAYIIDGDQEYTDGTRTVSRLVMAVPSAVPRSSAHPTGH